MSTGLNNNSENALLLLIFQNTAWANIGNSGGLQPSSAAGSFYIALHTGSGPGQSGTSQATNEAAYPSYARQGVARSSSGWTVSGSSPTTSSNAAAINFPAATGGSETETYVSVGVSSSGATEYLFFGTCTNVAVSSPIQPIIPLGDLTCTLQ
jgi:hypothetical protein